MSVDTTEGAYGSLSFDADTGVWTYTLDEAKANSLEEGATATETFTVTVTDEHGQTVQQVIT
ncbi:VCBS domain-containing protein, partial [Shewanella colwelliana]